MLICFFENRIFKLNWNFSLQIGKLVTRYWSDDLRANDFKTKANSLHQQGKLERAIDVYTQAIALGTRTRYHPKTLIVFFYFKKTCIVFYTQMSSSIAWYLKGIVSQDFPFFQPPLITCSWAIVLCPTTRWAAMTWLWPTPSRPRRWSPIGPKAISEKELPFKLLADTRKPFKPSTNVWLLKSKMRKRQKR